MESHLPYEVKVPTLFSLRTRKDGWGSRVLKSSHRDWYVWHQMRQEEVIMGKVAIWAQLESKPGKEKELEEFLKSAQPLAEREPGTLSWYAIKMGPGKYGIFDTFADENGRNAHLNGEIAKALFAKAKDLLATAPKIDKPEILASKK